MGSAPSGQELQDPLTKLYKGVLEEYFSDEEAQGLFRSVLGQLLSAFEPLSIQSLTTLQQHSPNDADDDADSGVEVLHYCYVQVERSA